jgi:peptide methionine sulfoxide reductase msrA/msrB
LAKAYFAGGCFWGVEFFFEKQSGVSAVISGYMGGELQHPSYYDVSYTHTNHVELVEVQYEPSQVGYETLARLFFEIHDPTQVGAQGPDVGDQYSSMVFYGNLDEKRIAERLIELLRDNGYEVVTVVQAKDAFWRAEEDHQDYYSRKGGVPYCHGYTKRF